MATNRATDHRCEEVIGKYLDNHFYSELSSRFPLTFARHTDRDFQLRGCDVEMKTRTGSGYIDEKAKIYNICEPVDAFGFEIDSLQRGVLTAGWLMREGLITTHYLLADIWASTIQPSQLTESNISGIGLFMIRKRDIFDLLKALGVEPLEMVCKAKELRAKNDEHDYIRRASLAEDIHLTISPQIEEKPLNLVLPRHYIAALPSAKRYWVTNSTCELVPTQFIADEMQASIIDLRRHILEIEEKLKGHQDDDIATCL